MTPEESAKRLKEFEEYHEQHKSIDDTLAERKKSHGTFTEHATCCQDLKATMQMQPNWLGLDPDMREALDMIQHKISRILVGNPKHHDSWHDIVGYAKLVADRLAEEA